MRSNFQAIGGMAMAMAAAFAAAHPVQADTGGGCFGDTAIETGGPAEGALPVDLGDWRTAWRLTRNAMIEADPGMQRDPTSVMVQFTESADEGQRAMVRAAIGGTVIETWDLVPGLEHLAIACSVDDAVAIATMVGGATGAVEFAEPDAIARVSGTPDDALFARQWALQNRGQTVNNVRGTAGDDIRATAAWGLTTGSDSIVVAMVDTGILRTHEDLAANIWRNPGETASNRVDDDHDGYVDDTWGWDFYNNDNDPTDDHGHGTHTAGTVGAAGNNHVGVSGVCWNVRLAALKVGSRTGAIVVSAAVGALDYCVKKHIMVSNHSWGGPVAMRSFSAAVTRARAAGHLLVCAAGNDGTSNDSLPSYPASLSQDNVISVAATDARDALASYSNRGVRTVDLGAPGSNILSTYIHGTSNGTYAYLSGTSMAAPHVTGAAALVWSRHSDWGYAQVRTRLLDTVRPVASLHGLVATGGVLDVGEAVR